MPVLLHPHAKGHLLERGGSESEVQGTVEEGEQFEAKFGRTGFRRNFIFDALWNDKYYASKQIEAYAIQENGV